MRQIYRIMKSDKKDKKYMVITPEGNKIYFGATGYNDFIIWNKLRAYDYAKKRKENYIERHKINENWTKSGINTSGFWARWILWNLETFKGSVEDTEKRFKINIIG